MMIISFLFSDQQRIPRYSPAISSPQGNKISPLRPRPDRGVVSTDRAEATTQCKDP